ncbi:Maf family protein [Sediminimonas sp.]|uniref:Maf family protein n=1 Tax=Sediminimonas sp. TaxID=2823379 RepID=UPI0025EE8D4F|nr:Maf family protein [Sediminimonas sp.]
MTLASGSQTRRQMLANAGVDFNVQMAGVDEDAVRTALQAEGAIPRDIADALAEHKARRVSAKAPEPLVIGCDQVLEFEGVSLSKSSARDEAAAQLRRLRGHTHSLLSAAVIYEAGAPVWRHVGKARLHMRAFSDMFLDDYLDRNWPAVQSSVGSYQIESEGIRLFSRIEGDYFSILGLPLLEVLTYLTQRGVLKE